MQVEDVKLTLYIEMGNAACVIIVVMVHRRDCKYNQL